MQGWIFYLDPGGPGWVSAGTAIIALYEAYGRLKIQESPDPLISPPPWGHAPMALCFTLHALSWIEQYQVKTYSKHRTYISGNHFDRKHYCERNMFKKVQKQLKTENAKEYG